MAEIIITLVVVGLVFFLMRKGGIGCCGGHSHADQPGTHSHDNQKKERTQKGCH